MLRAPDGQIIELEYDTKMKLWLLAYKDPIAIAGAAIKGMSVAAEWHLRAAHLNFKAIARGSHHCRGMPILLESNFNLCHTCMHCKARHTGPGHLGVDLDTIARQPLALISGDLAGPMWTIGIDGN